MIREIDSLLRAQGCYGVGRGKVPLLRITGLLAASGFLYGMAMGSSDVRVLQAVYSGSKVPLLLVASTLVCLPNFFVLNTILGLRDDFAAAFRAVLAAQATVAVALLGLAPLIVFAYVSIESYRFAIFANGVCFALATLAGQATLSRHYRPLVRANRRHEIGRWAWISLYVFVAIQLAWVLRPFIGSPGMPTRFFREDSWSNAYVVLVRDVLGIGG